MSIVLSDMLAAEHHGNSVIIGEIIRECVVIDTVSHSVQPPFCKFDG